MAIEFKLPELGENIESADIVKVLVSQGDNIVFDQVLVEIETDKATVEVPSDAAGVVKDIFVKEGDNVKIGQVLLTIETNGEVKSETVDVKREKGNVKSKKEKSSVKNDEELFEKESKINKKANAKKQVVPEKSREVSLVEIKIPPLGENIEEADIIKVLINTGDKIIKDQSLIEIETDKASAEIPSDYSGIIKEVKVKEGDKAKVGEVIAVIETAGKEEKKESDPELENHKDEEKTSGKDEVKEEIKSEEPKSQLQKFKLSEKIVPAAPSVRRFAREIGVDIHVVDGSGPGGRISINDVKSFAKSLNERISKSGNVFTSPGLGEPHPDFSKWGEIERTQMSNVRKKTAGHLSYAWSTIPHVTQFDKADITELEKLRKQFSKLAEDAGGKLTITAVLLKVVASALKLFPQFNSSIDMEKKEIIYKKYYHIGVAVDTDRGLLVPVIRDVDEKNIIELSVELNELSQKARDKKISLEEMQGGTFSISNLGGIGGTNFTPVVNAPEVAILGVARGNYEPVYQDGEFIPKLMLPLSLSYDHRIIDGADGIRFLRWIVDALEQPFLLSIEG